jgi:hypothetical protein
MRSLVALALLLGGCAFSFGGADEPCPPNGWLAAADITLGAGAAITGAVAAYPCVGDVEQSDLARGIHCASTAVGIALGVVYALSARRGLRDRRRCHGTSVAGTSANRRPGIERLAPARPLPSAAPASTPTRRALASPASTPSR